jgi:hypothetical protein
MLLTLAALAASVVMNGHDTSFYPHDIQADIIARSFALTEDAGA